MRQPCHKFIHAVILVLAVVLPCSASLALDGPASNVGIPAAEFVKWLSQEARRQPPLEGGFIGRIPQMEVCGKANTVDIQEEGPGAIEQLTQSFPPDVVKEDHRLQEWRLSTDALLARIVRIACEDREFLVYDPSPGSSKSDGAAPLYDGYPSCTNGPRLLIAPHHVDPLTQAIRSFEKLDRLAFVCVAIASIDPKTGPAILWNLSGDVGAIDIINSRIDGFNWRDGTIGQLRLTGTIAPNAEPLTGTLAPFTPPDSKPTSGYPGVHVNALVITAARVKRVTIQGARIRTAMLIKLAVDDAIDIISSSFTTLSISNSQLKDISVSMTEIGYENEQGGGLHFTANRVSGDARFGLFSDSLNAVASFQIPHEHGGLGHSPPWTHEPDNAAVSLRVRGYITMAQSIIQGALLIQNLRLAGHEIDERASEPQQERSDAFFNINLLSARRIVLHGSIIRLGRSTSLVATGVTVAEDIVVERSAFVWRDADLKDPLTLNRPTGKLELDGKNATIGFDTLKARDVKFLQSLVSGPIFFTRSEVRSLEVATASRQSEQAVSPAHCRSTLAGENLASDQSQVLRGGAWVVVPWPHAPVEARHPACYGSIIFQQSRADTITASGLLTDVVVLSSQIRDSLHIQGRVSGDVNIANLFAKDAVVTLGSPRRPLHWCSTSALVLDGAQLAALQADAASFLRYNCDRADAREIAGTLAIGLRGARIGQLMGHARLTSSDPVDAGLLGLSSERLIEISSQALARRPPIWLRLLEFTRNGFSSSRSPESIDFDPQVMADLSKKLREAGYAAKANDLSMERVRLQKWQSGDVLDRIKWIAGLPIGWGYKSELALVYALLLVFTGAWVSAYYRLYPHDAQHTATVSEPVHEPEAENARRGGAHWVGGVGVLALLSATVIFFWLSPMVPLDETETLVSCSALLCVFVFCTSGITRAITRSGTLDDICRFASAWRELGAHAFFFSLDRLLPTPGFHAHWANYPRIGQMGRNYFYAHRLIGLVLISVVAASVTGLFE